jgi:hypothetical protein
MTFLNVEIHTKDISTGYFSQSMMILGNLVLAL